MKKQQQDEPRNKSEPEAKTACEPAIAEQNHGLFVAVEQQPGGCHPHDAASDHLLIPVGILRVETLAILEGQQCLRAVTKNLDHE